MKTAFTVIVAIVIAAVGCYASAHMLPAGMPRYLGQIGSVLAGFGACFGGLRLDGGR